MKDKRRADIKPYKTQNEKLKCYKPNLAQSQRTEIELREPGSVFGRRGLLRLALKEW